MDAILSLLTPQTIDMILSDPLLLVGASLVILGTILFLFSAIKFFLHKPSSDFVVPHHPLDDEVKPAEPESLTNGKMENTPVTPEPQPEPEPEPAPTRSFRRASADETIIMPPGVADLQAQFEIAINQIKQLNKKVFELERQIETLGSRSESKLEVNELREPPMDANDFTKKLLKVVEHVIVLEKEVARLRQPSEEANPTAKPPIMPL
jgi:hypothetical protein